MDQEFTASNPFFASIRHRAPLSGAEMPKGTHHVVLDLHEGGLDYQVGDSIGVLPEHDPALIEETLQVLGASGEEEVTNRSGEARVQLRNFLTTKANLTDIQRKLVREVAARHPKPEWLESLLLPENKEAWKAFAATHDVPHFLAEHPNVVFSPQELCDLLLPLLPRFYSVASSPQHVGSEVHLTIASVEFVRGGKTRRGVCSHYLCQKAPLGEREVPVFVQPARHFRLPSDPNTPMIMIGPGTGVAPFRAFMQERTANGHDGKNWLFFGECHRKTDFFYEGDWLSWESEGKLRLSLAFSRDQEHKVYVQHRMWEEREHVFSWLEEGAFLYVCGDAKSMAKEVDATLLKIIEEVGGVNAKEYVKKMRKDRRYLRDVY